MTELRVFIADWCIQNKAQKTTYPSAKKLTIRSEKLSNPLNLSAQQPKKSFAQVAGGQRKASHAIILTLANSESRKLTHTQVNSTKRNIKKTVERSALLKPSHLTRCTAGRH